MILWILGGILFVGPIYIFGFIFFHGSLPGKDRNQDAFIDKTCSDSSYGLVKSVLTWGYFKASFRRFREYYKLFFTSVPVATLGMKAVDARLVDLDGKELLLINDFISKVPSHIPLILNMGSYTWPPFACNVDGMKSISDHYCTGSQAVAQMLTIYIEEAHAADEWKLPESKVEEELTAINSSINVHRNISGI
jgi:hypothetical protein